MNLTSRLKRTATAFAVAGLMTTGIASKAHAIELSAGDLVFALFGNTQEYILNLGDAATLLAPGATTTFTIDAATLAAVGGASAVQWAIVGYTLLPPAFEDPEYLFAGSSKAPSAFTPTELASTAVGTSWNTTAVWEALLNDGSGSSILLTNTNPNSFTSAFGTAGALGGGFPVSMQGVFGGTLSIIQGDFSTNALSLLGNGVLSANGSLLTINGAAVNAIPIPASLVLFGTGLASLVGMARRRLLTA